MIRRGLSLSGVLLAVALLLAHCGDDVPTPPLACDPIAAPDPSGWPDDVVWGFADLHAHPAIDEAFDGHLIWGTALEDRTADASELPMIETCPVETHRRNANSPLNRAVGEKVFPQIAELSGYPHAPVGSISGAWPDARDVIHQEMHLSAVRRAYEGGLRLMFASTTHDQAITSMLTGPNVANGFVADVNADFDSARRQFARIRTIVSRNSTWMGLAETPGQARALIRDGKLALVLSLELNGLTEQQTAVLVEQEGARHIIPIHLTDNEVGGMAASADLFNLTSSVVSKLHRPDQQDLRYMDLAATPRHARPIGWPLEVQSLEPAPLYIQPGDVPYSRYASLCYEPLLSCAGTEPVATSFLELGQENARGLCPTNAPCDVEAWGGRRIRGLMARRATHPTFVDVSHMSRRSVEDTLGLQRDGDPVYPLMASHGDILHLCERSLQPGCEDDVQGPLSERSLEADSARELVRRHGVLGLGTSTGTYAARAVFAARGGPLLALSEASPSACVALPDGSGSTAGCERIPPPDAFSASKELRFLDVATNGGVPSHVVGNARPFVRIELRSRVEEHAYQRRVIVRPLACTAQACSASVPIPARDEPYPFDRTSPAVIASCAPLDCQGTACGSSPHTLDDVERVTLEWQYLGCDVECQREAGSSVLARQCRSTWGDDRAAHWRMNEVSLSARASAHDAAIPLVHLGPRSTPTVDLGGKRGQFVLFRRDDRPSVAAAVPATGHLLKISLSAAPDTSLKGASASAHGANVCVALRRRDGASCVSTLPPITAGTTECPGGWSNLTQRGSWTSGVTLWTFARFSGREDEICGLDVSVLDWAQTKPFAIDAVRVEAIEDPVGRFVRRYAALSRQIADSRVGAFAFGTDANGLNGLTDISEHPVPAGARAASVCPVRGAEKPAQPLPLAPTRIRYADGTLGAKILIEERGFATYGLLADMMAVIADYPGCGKDVRDSLMLSAEATLRAWEWISDPTAAAERERAHPLPRRTFACGRAPGLP